MRRGSRQAKAIKEDVLKQTGITEDELQEQQPETHLPSITTSSESDMPAEFKRVVRKRQPSPVSTPSPRRTRQKQQAVRSPVKKTIPKKKLTPKKKRTQQNISPIDRLLDEILEEGKLKNIKKLYDTLSADEKEQVENSVILHLDIYKKFFMEVVDELPDELFKRLEARRQSVVELDKKIKIEKLLVVYPVNSPKEIDDLIPKANRSIFSTAHQHIALKAGRVNEVTEEIENGWDIFLVEKEKQKEYRNPKPIKVYQKDKDKGKGKVGGPPSIKIKDNLSPPPLITPLVTTTKDQPTDESMHVPQEDTNPNPEVLYTVDVDTQKVNIVIDKDTTGKTDMASEPPVADNTDNTEGKLTDGKIETQTKKQEKQQALEQEQAHVQIVPPATREKQKPLLKEMETRTDLPKVTTSMVTSSIGKIQNVGSSSVGYKSTNVTEVLLDSLKKITNCSSQAYKAIDDTIPILRMIAFKCNIDNKDSLSQLDTLSKYIIDNTVTVEQIKEPLFKDRLEIKKHKFFKDQIKKCTREFDTLLPKLCNILKECKNLYKDTCKTNFLTVDIDKKMIKVQEEMNKLADNFVNSLDTLSVFEQKITSSEVELLKLEREKERIINKAKNLRLRLSPRLDYLASLRKEMFEALVQGQKTPTEHMQHLTGIVQRIEVAIKDSKNFMESINLVLADHFQIVTTQLPG